MPTVRTYGDQKVETQPFPNVRMHTQFTPQEFGAGLGGDIAQIGDAIMRHETDSADQLAVLSASNQLKQWTRTALYGSPDGSTPGALATQGKDAFTSMPDQVTQAYSDQADQIGQGLANDRQRLAFAKVRSDQADELNRALQVHSFEQRQAYDDNETKSALDLSVSDAGQNAGNPVLVAQAYKNGLDTLTGYAQRHGMGPEQLAQKEQAFATSFHSAVIGRLLADQQTQGAQVYFDNVKHQLSGEAVTEIEKALRQGTLDGQSQKAADDILGQNISESDALEQVKAIQDPKLRDEVQQRVEHGFALKERAAALNREQLMIQAGNMIDANPGKGMLAIPPSIRAQFTPEEKRSLDLYAKRNAQMDGGEGKTDWQTYYNLMQQSSSDPETFASRNLMLSLPKLGKTEFKQLTEIQNSIRNGDRNKADAQLDGFRSSEQVINDTLDQAGIPRTGQNANLGEIATFRRLVDEQTQVLERSTGKKATKDDIQKIADDVMSRQVTQPSGFWSTMLWGRSSSNKRLIDTTIDDVPSAARQQIVDSFKQRGITPSDDQILQVFVQGQLRGKR